MNLFSDSSKMMMNLWDDLLECGDRLSSLGNGGPELPLDFRRKKLQKNSRRLILIMIFLEMIFLILGARSQISCFDCDSQISCILPSRAAFRITSNREMRPSGARAQGASEFITFLKVSHSPRI